MTIHLLKGPNAGYKELSEKRLFTSYEQLLFSRVVALAEKAGKPVDLLVVPASNVYQAIVQTAARLYSSEIILGHSTMVTPSDQALRLGDAWEKLPKKPSHQVKLRIFNPSGEIHEFSLGAHAPELKIWEINLIHQLWLELKREMGRQELHHADIVAIALERMEQELQGPHRDSILQYLRHRVEHPPNHTAYRPPPQPGGHSTG
jgi:hypothetical protein